MVEAGRGVMTPLYNHANWKSLVNSSTAHPGLLFDKYPNGWEIATGAQGPEITLPKGTKEEFYHEIIDKYGKNELASALSKALARQNMLVENILGGIVIEVKTDWRFVSGLCSGHPYETGFIWHRTLAVPYLPGSSVKGMMRAWAEQWLEDVHIKDVIDTLLGPEEKSPEKAAGSLIVFDALPVAVPQIELDILNPHYKTYYENPETTPPADYLNPVPVFFLTVAPHQAFCFSIAHRPQAHDTPEQATHDLQQGLRLLKEALSTIGAGGKTAVGYGVMVETIESERKRIEKERKEQSKLKEMKRLEAIEKEIERLGYKGIAAETFKQAQQEEWETNYEKYAEAVKKWLPVIEQEQDPAIRNQCIDLFSEILNKKYPGIMQGPEKKRGKKMDKFCYPKLRSREMAKQLIHLRNISR
jgi:CRISPR-associated protein Cmr6